MERMQEVLEGVLELYAGKELQRGNAERRNNGLDVTARTQGKKHVERRRDFWTTVLSVVVLFCFRRSKRFAWQ
jgi:hypothetical protein